MSLDAMRIALRTAEADFNRKAGEASAVVKSLKSVQHEIKELDKRSERLERIAVVLSKFADIRQEAIQSQIEGVVTQGLRTIFGEPMSFRIVNKMVGKRPEIDFLLVSETGAQPLETAIMEARGGGVAAVAGFLLQAVLVLLLPNTTPLLFLDESFSQVSEEYRPALSQFIKELTERTDLQVVLVTHSDEFVTDADRVYRFSQQNGVTKVEESVSP
jgi:DNA repair exonuclease SbcCD ATPase subunit